MEEIAAVYEPSMFNTEKRTLPKTIVFETCEREENAGR